jgi:RNA polymerase sigma-70 factor, ECF subfamily
MPLADRDSSAAPLTDEQAIAAARRGDPAGLASLYQRHGRALFAIAYRLLQSREDAEDVVHDVFVGLPEALRHYEERGALLSWLRKLSARVALARLRKANTHPTAAIGADQHLFAPSSDPHTTLTLEHALRDLSPPLRAVLVLKEIEGFSHREIAVVLDISVGASEVRLHRALRALRAVLTEGEKS